MERRIRLKRPISIWVFGIFFLVLPVVQYGSFSLITGISFLNPKAVFSVMNWSYILLNLVSVVVGIGLLMVKLWAWYLFLVYGIALVSYNLGILFLDKSVFTATPLVNSVVMVALIGYFLQKDVSAPYFRVYPRGWRGQKRFPVQVSVKIEGKKYLTHDFSEGGFFVRDNSQSFELNKGYSGEIFENGNSIPIKLGAVRFDNYGFGFAFRNLNVDQKKTINNILKNQKK